jgi:hypothetical protein
MSGKSIGFNAIALKDGVYTQAKITVDQQNQVIALESQVIESAGNDLLQEYDQVLTDVKNLQNLEKVIQTTLKDATERMPLLQSTNDELVAETADLQTQYEASLAAFQQATNRFKPVFVLNKSVADLNIGQIKTDSETVNNGITIQTPTLDKGYYQLYINLLGLVTIGGSLVAQPNPPNPMVFLYAQNNLELQVTDSTLLGKIISNDFAYQGDQMQCSICNSCSFYVNTTKTITITLNFFNAAVGASGTSGGTFFLTIPTTSTNTFGLPIQTGGSALSILKISD